MSRLACAAASALLVVLVPAALADDPAHPPSAAAPATPATPAGPAAPAPRPAPLAIGAPAPATDVMMTGVDGRQASIASVKGSKGTLVIFTCNHCPYVKAWQERLVEVANGAGARGIGVIAVNSNDPGIVAGDSLDHMRELARARKYAFPYVVDEGSKVARAFGAGRTPEVFLLDAEGRLAYRGAIDDNSADPKAVTQRYLADAIDALSAGREIAVKETKAIGCSIKFGPPSG